MSDITTLVRDINRVLTPSEDGGVGEEVLRNFAERTAHHVKDTLELREDRDREGNVLYASEVGERCTRKLYYRLTNHKGEAIPAHTHYKFLYGDVVEEITLLLAEAAGHKVEHCQEKVVAKVGDWEVRGRIDAVIDGVPVDVKSMSTYGYNDLPSSLDEYEDKFGYVDQVSFYRNWRFDSETVGILGVDKTLGHIRLSLGRGLDKGSQAARVGHITTELEKGVPDRAYQTVPEGKSGNEKLGVQCSYCPFKQECWPGLRTFLYSKGPVYLTRVMNEPNVPEVRND